MKWTFIWIFCLYSCLYTFLPVIFLCIFLSYVVSTQASSNHGIDLVFYHSISWSQRSNILIQRVSFHPTLISVGSCNVAEIQSQRFSNDYIKKNTEIVWSTITPSEHIKAEALRHNAVFVPWRFRVWISVWAEYQTSTFLSLDNFELNPNGNDSRTPFCTESPLFTMMVWKLEFVTSIYSVFIQATTAVIVC